LGDERLIHPEPVPAGPALQANLTLDSLWFCYALRFSLAAGIGLSLSRSLGLDKGYWVLITIAAVVKPQLSLSTTATIHRVGGTLLGAILAILVIISLSSGWGLVAALFVLTVIAASLIQVNYGIAVVFITPIVLVLLNVAQPGHWQLADTRVVNSLLGAGIGLLVTTAILPRPEGGLIMARTRIALKSSAHYLRAIGHQSRSQRLLARRAARAAADDLVALVDRAAAEPLGASESFLDAATRAAAAIADLWVHEAALALSVPAEMMTPTLRRRIDEVTACIEHLEWALARSGPPVLSHPGCSYRDGAPLAGETSLSEFSVKAVRSLEIASAQLATAAAHLMAQPPGLPRRLVHLRRRLPGRADSVCSSSRRRAGTPLRGGGASAVAP
jgi:uncharacterized membrane protein YccC